MKYSTTLLILVLTVLSGCSGGSDANRPAARVGRAVVTRGELAALYGLPVIESSKATLSNEQRYEEAARKWVDNEILVQEARRRGLDRDSLYQARLENLNRELLISLLCDQNSSTVQVDSLEILTCYQEHRPEYVTAGDQIDLLYVIAPTRDLANEVRHALQNDSSLTDIITSDDRLVGETTGWIGYHELDPNLAKAAFSLVPGGISYPLKHNDSGYIVLRCLQRRSEGTTLPLEEVYGTIHSRLLLHKQRMAEKTLRDSLWKAYNPVIYVDVENQSESAQN